jgi:hypothetical protein
MAVYALSVGTNTPAFNLEGNRKMLFAQAREIAQNQDMSKPMRTKLLEESKSL